MAAAVAEHWVAGLCDELRPRAPRQIGDDDVAEVVRQTLETTPVDAVNDDPKPFRWTKSADNILATIKRFCLKSLEIAAVQTEIARNSEPGH